MSEEVTRSAHSEASRASGDVKRLEQLEHELRAARTRAEAAESALEQTKRALANRDADATPLRAEKDRLFSQVEQARALSLEFVLCNCLLDEIRVCNASIPYTVYQI